MSANRLGAAGVDVSWREVADAGMAVVVVVPGEEDPAEVAGVQLGSESVGEVRPVLEGLKLRFAERIGVGRQLQTISTIRGGFESSIHSIR